LVKHRAPVGGASTVSAEDLLLALVLPAVQLPHAAVCQASRPHGRNRPAVWNVSRRSKSSILDATMPASGWRAKAAVTSSSQCASASVSLFKQRDQLRPHDSDAHITGAGKAPVLTQRQHCTSGYSAANSGSDSSVEPLSTTITCSRAASAHAGFPGKLRRW